MKRIISLILILTISLSLNTCASPDALPSPDYISLMIDAAVSGDKSKGRRAEAIQERLLKENPGSLQPVDFDELLLLSRFISADAGSRLHSDEYLMCTGEVIMNRVISPEFPDSIKAVIYDGGQYDFVNTPEFEELLPERACVNAALRLLQGKRLMKSSVVFKSDFQLGKVYASFCDRVLGFIYFCESPNQELYSIQNYPPAESFYLSSASEPKISMSADSFRDYKDSSIIVISEAAP